MTALSGRPPLAPLAPDLNEPPLGTRYKVLATTGAIEGQRLEYRLAAGLA